MSGQPVQRARHCAECDIDVNNLSAMTASHADCTEVAVRHRTAVASKIL